MILRIGILSLTSFNGISLIIAQASSDPLLPAWGQLGVMGLIVIAFLTEVVVTGKKYNAVVKERDEERARTEKAEAKLEEKFFPVMQESHAALTMVNEQILPILIELRKVLIVSHEDERSRQEDRNVVPEIKKRGR